MTATLLALALGAKTVLCPCPDPIDKAMIEAKQAADARYWFEIANLRLDASEGRVRTDIYLTTHERLLLLDMIENARKALRLTKDTIAEVERERR